MALKMKDLTHDKTCRNVPILDKDSEHKGIRELKNSTFYDFIIRKYQIAL